METLFALSIVESNTPWAIGLRQLAHIVVPQGQAVGRRHRVGDPRQVQPVGIAIAQAGNRRGAVAMANAFLFRALPPQSRRLTRPAPEKKEKTPPQKANNQLAP